MCRIVSVQGFTPDNVNYCPECGAEFFPDTTYADGKMRCDKCGLTCYIVEGEDSHEE